VDERDRGGRAITSTRVAFATHTERDMNLPSVKLNVALALALLAAFSVSGCNTIEGAGEDIQKGGEAVEQAAEDAQK